MNTTDIIKETLDMCALFGPSGYEDEVREYIKARAEQLCDSVMTDAMGNLICTVEGLSDRHTLMLEAHMDEVGMMIRQIEENGLLRFGCVGGIDPRVLSAKRVTVRGRDCRDMPGVIASKPIHLKGKDERQKVTGVDEMYIDIGASSREEAESAVETGDYAVFDSPSVMLGDNKIKAKAIDDRLGCAVMLSAMRRLHEEHITLPYKTVFCFGVREEVGFSGAKVSAFRIRPDHALVLESTAVADIADVKDHLRVADQGKGGALSLADLGTLYPKDMIKWAEDTAKRRGIPVQEKRYVSGSNNSRHISQSACGVKVLALSAPTRYIHSPACVMDRRDALAIEALVYELILNYDSLLNEEEK